MQDITQELIKQNYLYGNEKTADDIFHRVSKALAKDDEMQKRLFGYLKDKKFMFATPIIANIGTDRGLPISCFVNEVSDSREGIFDTFTEISYLSSDGGGIGTNWSNVREINAPIRNKGVSSGIIPFIKVTESLSGAVSQGGLRRASQASYLHISHPEIEEFISLRREFGADLSRRCPHLHHGVIIDDEFMQCVIDDKEYTLISPKTKEKHSTINARELWFKILTTRIETGEPYLIFEDNVNKNLPEYYKRKGYKIHTSNLCTEIFQHTDTNKSAVCALGSINLAMWDKIKNNKLFFADIVYAMNSVLNIFIQSIENNKFYSKALKSVVEERNIGIGVMGLHSYLQSKLIPFESSTAINYNRKILSTIKDNVELACKAYSVLYGYVENVMKLAIAPTSSISIICDCVSAGIEPYIANIYTHKIGIGNFIMKNPYLEKWLQENDLTHLWKSITANGGSVQHLDEIPKDIKDVFKTAYEINQRWIIELAKHRQEFICQGQSLNLFIRGDISKQELNNLHITAWKSGLKSLYYLRSTAVQEVGLSNDVDREIILEDECIACQ